MSTSGVESVVTFQQIDIAPASEKQSIGSLHMIRFLWTIMGGRERADFPGVRLQQRSHVDTLPYIKDVSITHASPLAKRSHGQSTPVSSTVNEAGRIGRDRDSHQSQASTVTPPRLHTFYAQL